MINHLWTEILTSMLMNEIRRDDMPQVKDSGHVKRIMNHCSVTPGLTKCSDLKPIQENAIKEKVRSMVDDLGDMPLKEWPPIIISEDNYIVDGHHRWLAAIYLHGDNAYIPSFQMDLPKKEALALADRMQSVEDLQEGKRLAVFDFDHTLVTTSSQIYVRDSKSGDVVKKLPQDHDYTLAPHEEFDFTEFTDNQLRSPSTVRGTFRIFKDFAKRQSSNHKTIILTARGAYKPIKKWLKDIGLQNVYVVALNSHDPHDKARWIENEIHSGFTHVVFYDDKLENVRAVDALREKYPRVKIKTQHVKR